MDLILTYRDEIGLVQVTLDFPTIEFYDGDALFAVNGEEYTIPISAIVRIDNE